MKYVFFLTIRKPKVVIRTNGTQNSRRFCQNDSITVNLLSKSLIVDVHKHKQRARLLTDHDS